LIALTLLLSASLEEAAPVAQKMMAETTASPELRRDAFQIYLLTCTKVESRREAIKALEHEDAMIREFGLIALGEGARRMQALRGGHLYVDHVNEELLSGLEASGQPIVPEAPKGLKVEMVRPFLKSDDPRVRANAGYLLALLGEADGLETLLLYWRAKERTDTEWQKLVYRAISALKDDSQVRIVEEIYRLDKDRYTVRDLYWTIRSMEGPNALRLRKVIRDEVGMDSLR
jgi:hypothetical protein